MSQYKYTGYKPTTDNWLTSRPDTKFGFHGGNDNPAPAGTPVYAENDGTVFRSGNINGYGLAVLSSDLPDAASGAGSPPLAPTPNGAWSPPLGIFSGKPMPDHVVWPSIFATDDRPSPDDDELYQRWRRWLDV
jgi:hypothetical protein